MRKLQT